MHWVASWTNAQPLIRMAIRPGPNPVAVNFETHGFHDQTIRMVVHTTLAGSKLRIKLSNPFGGAPLKVGRVHVGIRRVDSEILPETDRAVSFNGQPGCSIGPGVVIVSDPVDLPVLSQSDIAVSLYLPDDTGPPSAHNGLHTTYIASGDESGATVIQSAVTTPVYYWLAAIDVLAPADAALAVALGDSITEGWRSTADTNRSWPARLSARLSTDRPTLHVALANMGIGGNRILHDGIGASALARFDRDVLGQSGVKWVMLLEGINDLGHDDTDPVSADELLGGYRQIIERAHGEGIKVIGCTLPPYAGAAYFRESGEALRQALNGWIRHGGVFDAVVDFDVATRDPTDPKRLRPEFDPGDHLHLNDAGYQAMADAVDLSIFTPSVGKGAAARSSGPTRVP